MPSIIATKNGFVKTEAISGVFGKKSAKMQEKLAAQLLEIYEDLTIAFMGTPEFAVPIFEMLCKNDFKPKAVFTAPDKPAGRGQEITPPPIKVIAQKYGIAVFQPQTRDELINQTIGLKPDLIIVVAYGKILPKEILALPKYGAINVHPSLLPKYRGPSPIQFPILNGEKETGVTIMLMNEQMDEGAILAQEDLKIEADETAQTLENKLSRLASKLLIKTLNQWLILKEMPKSAQELIFPQEQDNSKATYTKILTKQDGKIIWDKSAQELSRQIRAFIPWPGSFTFFKPTAALEKNIKNLVLKILKARPSEIQTDKELGQAFLTDGKKLAIQTGQGALIMEELQIEGGKPMDAASFLNGHPEIIGTILQ